MPRFEHEGISHFYTDVGQGDPLVFIHGLGLSHQNWIAQAPVFSTRYRMVTYDCRGHGGTGTTKGKLSIRDLAGDLLALLDHLGIERAVLIGYSTGTLIAQSFAVNHPDRTAGICCIGSIDRVNNLYLRVRMDFSRWMIHSKLHKALAYSVATSNAKNLVQRGFFYRIAKRADPTESVQMIEASQEFLHEHDITKITCPTLLVHGKKDKSSGTNAAALTEKIRHAQISVVDGVNHAVATRAADAFNAVLEEWLQGLDLRAGESQKRALPLPHMVE
ncbi:alpha/beta hydrolase [Tumebacillus sp. DT12]|uniref:Alpha/beta hydrolase n=1 Tax=Tumebacillus lacus TaxID=2995335 RepID=A0ABT3X3V3_9BACL|nr:alpha/beta hydrolase [Tumebacillus lacus]MCX7571574.1 alpha/beta hydrolase [Tumebacillus lacus]